MSGPGRCGSPEPGRLVQGLTDGWERRVEREVHINEKVHADHHKDHVPPARFSRAESHRPRQDFEPRLKKALELPRAA